MSKLKPCPFCGAVCDEEFAVDDVESIPAKTVYITSDKEAKVYFIECGWCHARGSLAETKELAISDWNMRQFKLDKVKTLQEENTKLKAEIKKLTFMLKF